MSSPSGLLTPAFLVSCLLHESRPPVFRIMPRTHSPVNGYFCVSTGVCIENIYSFHGFTFLADKKAMIKNVELQGWPCGFMRALGRLKSYPNPQLCIIALSAKMAPSV